MSEPLKDFIVQCTKMNPDERPDGHLLLPVNYWGYFFFLIFLFRSAPFLTNGWKSRTIDSFCRKSKRRCIEIVYRFWRRRRGICTQLVEGKSITHCALESKNLFLLP